LARVNSHGSNGKICRRHRSVDAVDVSWRCDTAIVIWVALKLGLELGLDLSGLLKGGDGSPGEDLV
jgi:hypothetical protein